MSYQLLAWGGVKDLSTNAEIPPDPLNAQWQAYQAWLGQGNTPQAMAAPDPATLAAQKIKAGLAVASTATPAISATYAVDAQAEFNIVALETSLNAGQGFPGGATTFGYPDMAGVKHTMTASQFTALAAAIRDYIAALDATLQTLLAGGMASWPSASAPIA
jgi:hypothetical protein